MMSFWLGEGSWRASRPQPCETTARRGVRLRKNRSQRWIEGKKNTKANIRVIKRNCKDAN